MSPESMLLMLAGPPWLLAGLLDWACHRRLRIEQSSGLRESLLHLLMLAELGAGVLAVMWLEVNAATLCILLLACVAHELTVAWDLSYAGSMRPIPWYEQWVHGIQQLLPWMLLVALMVLNPDQTAAMVGLGGADPDWGLRLKNPPLPTAFLVGFMLAAVPMILLPYASETRRCWRAQRRLAVRS